MLVSTIYSIRAIWIFKELKKLGFKTFDSIWDERYDDEVNYEKRYDKV